MIVSKLDQLIEQAEQIEKESESECFCDLGDYSHLAQCKFYVGRIARLSFAADKFSALLAIVKVQREALKFYANGGTDLAPKPEKAHLYAKDYPMNSPEWLQRSMSDLWPGQLAREALSKSNALAQEVLR